MHARRDNIKAFPAHYGDKFYMLTNEFEPNYQYYEVVEEDFGQLRMIFSGSDNRGSMVSAILKLSCLIRVNKWSKPH